MSDTPRTISVSIPDYQKRLNELFAMSFDANHSASLDYARLCMELKQLRAQLAEAKAALEKANAAPQVSSRKQMPGEESAPGERPAASAPSSAEEWIAWSGFKLVYQGGHHNVYCDGSHHLRTSGGWASRSPVEIRSRWPMFKCNCHLFKEKHA